MMDADSLSLAAGHRATDAFKHNSSPCPRSADRLGPQKKHAQCTPLRPTSRTHQDLVDDRRGLVAARRRTSRRPQRVKLVHEQDGGRVLAHAVKRLADAARADARVHLRGGASAGWSQFMPLQQQHADMTAKYAAAAVVCRKNGKFTDPVHSQEWRVAYIVALGGWGCNSYRTRSACGV